MDEILQLLRNGTNRMNRRRMRHMSRSSIYVVCNELGSIFVINSNGQVIRKANVQAHQDIPFNNIEALRTLGQISRSISLSVTVLIRDKVSVTLMYCHRPSHTVDASCRKILLLGPTCLVFSNFQLELQDNVNRHRDQIVPGAPYPDQLYDLLDKDEIELSGCNQYLIRVSSNKHCIYINPNIFHRYVSYKSTCSDSHLKSIVNNLI